MPTIIAALWTALLALIPTIVGKVLIGLGIAYASYTGFSVLFTTATAALFSDIQGMGATVVSLAGVLQIGTAVNILASSYLARLAVDGLVNGVLTRQTLKGT